MRVNTTGAAAGWSDQDPDLANTSVRIGESTLAQVASRLGVSPQELQDANPQIENPNALTAGLELRLPPSTALSESAGETSADDAASAVSKRVESSLDSVGMQSVLTSSWTNSPGNVLLSGSAFYGRSGGITQQPPVHLHGEGYSADVKKALTEQLNTIYQTPQLQALSPQDREAVLQALSGKPPIAQEKIDRALDLLDAAKNLSPADHKAVIDAFTAGRADPTFCANLQKLINDPKFTSLNAAERTAVLSQVKNYPDPRSVSNITRLLHKDWFRDQKLDDKQRSLKLVGRLSEYMHGDRKIVDNTLNQLLDAGSDFRLNWQNENWPKTHYGAAGNNKLTLNGDDLINAGNDPMKENEDSDHVTFHTVAHEINHLVNHDTATEEEAGGANTFQEFNNEYRAWCVGFQAQHGISPSREQAMEQRIRLQLDPKSAYGQKAAKAMKNPAEAQKFYDFLSGVTGLKVDAHNWKQIVNRSNPDEWPNLSAYDAPRMAGNNDNS